MLSSPLDLLLDRPRRVLVVGIGGGFDVVCGLPLVLALLGRGHEVHLANLTFTRLDRLDEVEEIGEEVIRVDADSFSPEAYFPEGYLSQWFRQARGEERPVHLIRQRGLPGVTAAYRELAERLGIDLLLQVDGGVDGLLRGDEYSLGTPTWDAISLAAAYRTEVRDRVVAFVGFGAERWDGISHTEALAALARLAGSGALLGVEGLLREGEEGREFLDALRYVHGQQGALRHSIVASTIAAALAGRFGDYAVNERTHQTPIWVSPLAQLVWFVNLVPLIEQKGYLEGLLGTHTVQEASSLIEGHHSREGRKEPLPFPI